jgi:hypothetical protein
MGSASGAGTNILTASSRASLAMTAPRVVALAVDRKSGTTKESPCLHLNRPTTAILKVFNNTFTGIIP